MSVQPESTTTQKFRQMLHTGQGQPIPQWAKDEARAAMMDAYNVSKSTREACQVYEEVLRSYGYTPDDCEGDDL